MPFRRARCNSLQHGKSYLACNGAESGVPAQGLAPVKRKSNATPQPLAVARRQSAQKIANQNEDYREPEGYSDISLYFVADRRNDGSQFFDFSD
jgi:hypothetical protein